MSRVGAPRNASKAEVRFESRAGREVVIKDFSAAPLWFRWLIARRSLRREARTYERLRDLHGIPACLGLESPDRLVLARAAGRALDVWRAGTVPPIALDRLDRLIAQVHQRGVAISDLHRSNVLVDDQGEVSLVDFALARIGRRPERPGPLLRALQQLDRHAAARIRSRALGLPEPEPTGWFGRLYRFGRRLKRWVR